MTQDRVSIAGLRVLTRIGVTDEERSRPQAVVINVQATMDLAAAGKSDRLDDTMDYDSLTSAIAELARSQTSDLLEHLAESIAARVREDNRIEEVTVEVGKESAPVSEDVGSITVRITRP